MIRGVAKKDLRPRRAVSEDDVGRIDARIGAVVAIEIDVVELVGVADHARRVEASVAVHEEQMLAVSRVIRAVSDRHRRPDCGWLALACGAIFCFRGAQ